MSAFFETGCVISICIFLICLKEKNVQFYLISSSFVSINISIFNPCNIWKFPGRARDWIPAIVVTYATTAATPAPGWGLDPQLHIDLSCCRWVLNHYTTEGTPFNFFFLNFELLVLNRSRCWAFAPFSCISFLFVFLCTWRQL